MPVLPVEVDTDGLPLKEKSINIMTTVWQFDIFCGSFPMIIVLV